MADNNRPSRRPVAGSRNPSTAPRRIAGRTPRPAEPASASEKPTRKLSRPGRDRAKATEPSTSSDPAGRAPEAERTFGALSSPGTTKVLVGLLVALLVVGAVELGLGLWAKSGGGDDRQHVLAFDEDYVVRDKPVTVPMADWRDADDAAMKSVTEILNVSWKDYDKNLEDARDLITDRFEKEFASTSQDSRKLFMESKAEYDFAVVGTSVVEATPDEVATLLFLNQYVYKGEGKKRTGPEIYPVRVMVRMVRSDSGWLIDELHAL